MVLFETSDSWAAVSTTAPGAQLVDDVAGARQDDRPCGPSEALSRFSGTNLGTRLASAETRAAGLLTRYIAQSMPPSRDAVRRPCDRAPVALGRATPNERARSIDPAQKR